MANLVLKMQEAAGLLSRALTAADELEAIARLPGILREAFSGAGIIFFSIGLLVRGDRAKERGSAVHGN